MPDLSAPIPPQEAERVWKSQVRPSARSGHIWLPHIRVAAWQWALTAARDLALRRAMLPERRASATLGDMQLRSDLLNAATATRGA
jgi:hypothetical protein